MVYYASVEARWEVEPVWCVWQSRVVTHDMGSYSLEKKRISMQGGNLTKQTHISRQWKDYLNVMEKQKHCSHHACTGKDVPPAPFGASLSLLLWVLALMYLMSEAWLL